MKKITFLILGLSFLVLEMGCETIQNKSDENVKKENKKLSKFIGQPI